MNKSGDPDPFRLVSWQDIQQQQEINSIFIKCEYSKIREISSRINESEKIFFSSFMKLINQQLNLLESRQPTESQKYRFMQQVHRHIYYEAKHTTSQIIHPDSDPSSELLQQQREQNNKMIGSQQIKKIAPIIESQNAISQKLAIQLNQLTQQVSKLQQTIELKNTQIKDLQVKNKKLIEQNSFLSKDNYQLRISSSEIQNKQDVSDNRWNSERLIELSENKISKIKEIVTNNSLRAESALSQIKDILSQPVLRRQFS